MPGNQDPIPENALLWRRVPSIHAVEDKNTGERRPSSAAFQDITFDDVTGMSCRIASEVIAAGLGPDSLVQKYPQCGVIEFPASEVIACGLSIARVEVNPEGPGHVNVIGTKTGARKKHLVRSSKWVLAPP